MYLNSLCYDAQQKFCRRLRSPLLSSLRSLPCIQTERTVSNTQRPGRYRGLGDCRDLRRGSTIANEKVQSTQMVHSTLLHDLGISKMMM